MNSIYNNILLDSFDKTYKNSSISINSITARLNVINIIEG